MKKKNPAASKPKKKKTATRPKRKSGTKTLEKPPAPPVRTIKALGKVGTISFARIRAAVKAVAEQERNAIAAGNASSEN